MKGMLISVFLFRHLMMDLVIAMTPYVDGKNIKRLYDLALPWLQV